MEAKIAEISDNAGIPTVAPRIQAPDDYQHISTNPEQFGAGVGQSMRAAGQAFTSAATTALDMYNQVAANDATNKLQEGSNKILYGDPSKQVMGPDGTMQPDTGYRGLRGKAAMEQRAPITKQLNDLADQISANLPTPKAKLQFESESRRYRFNWEQQIGTFAEAGQREWTNSVITNQGDVGKNTIGAAPDDDAAYAQGLHTLRGAYVRRAQLEGTDIGAAITQADQEAAITRIHALIPTNPALAERVLNDNRGILSSSSDYDSLSYLVTSKANDVMSLHLADALSNVGPLTSLPASSDIKDAILGQESGGNNNVKSSITGAVGPMQIEPNTFKQFAKLGENINNPSDNRNVGNRIIDHLSQKFAGDSARIATGFFSGEGNVSPPGSLTPWIKDVADPTGKKVSSYVGDISRRMGGQSSAISNMLDGLTPDQKSVVMDKAVTEMHRRILETKQINAVNDDPARTAWMWHGIDTGQVAPQDILDATRNGYFTSGTASEMMKAIDNGPKRTAVEKDSFDVLKTALSGGAIDQGAISIFPQAEQAKAKQNWAEAQGEWSRRVLSGEDPRVVLNDMVPRYAPAIQHPTWLAPLQFGMVHSLPDVNKIAVATYQARQTNKIDQATYDKQVALLNQYKIFYGLQDRQIKAHQTATGKPPKPKPPAGGVTVAPETNP